MDDNVRRIPEPPTSTHDRLIAVVLTAVIVAVLLLLLLTTIGQLAG